MLKTQAVLEVKTGERLYQFNLPTDAPLGEVHDVLFQMRSYVIGKINDAQKADETKEVAQEVIKE